MRPRLLVIVLVAASVAGPRAIAETEVERKARATALWQEGATRYQLGRFDDAIDLFEKAYEVWPFPDILFNLCQAHRQMKRYEKAIFYCKAYLRESPGTANRDVVEELVIEMERTLEMEKSTNEQPPQGVAVPEAPARTDALGHSPYRPWKWASLAVGLLGVAGGVTLLALDGDRIVEGDRQPERYSTKMPGIVVTAGGAAAIATGVTLWILDAKWRPTARVIATPTRGGLSAAVEFAF